MNEDPGEESSPERHPHDAVLGWMEPLGRYVNVHLHPRARITLEVLVYRLDDRLFSANASYVRAGSTR
jgi:sulfate permease, SulP family